MRDIKFRAYDKENKKMVYSDKVFPRSCYKLEFDCFNDYEFRLMKMIDRYNVIDDKGCETYQEVFKAVDAHIMQYTGIKDANGKDVYDGDIVEFIFDGKLNKSKIFCSKENVLVYEYEKLLFNVYDLRLERRETKVIGNIYENPELLGE